MLTEVHLPDDPADVPDLLERGAVVLGGGTALMPRLNDHASPPTELVSVRRLGLDQIRVDDGRVELGAAVTLAQVEADPRLGILHPAVRSIASRPVRSLATVAGNLFVRQPYGDLTAALVALDAEVDHIDASGPRHAKIEDLLSTGLPGGLVTAIRFLDPGPDRFRFHKAARRRYNSASIVTVAAVVSETDGVVTGARVALSGVAPAVVRASAVEDALVGARLDEASVRAAAEQGLSQIDPSDDAYASAWYRRRVFPIHLRRALLGEQRTE